MFWQREEEQEQEQEPEEKEEIKMLNIKKRIIFSLLGLVDFVSRHIL